ncbi:uncharacterized protein VTP21DRAFT_7238 [Calcarisporiella thermophila]|uniref:uncharacterized protein n=1 Tax=Calcarisporiella thermophila TaxID=911321 RepID=UPI0037441165
MEMDGPTSVLPNGGVSSLVLGYKRKEQPTSTTHKQTGSDEKRKKIATNGEIIENPARSAIVPPVVAYSQIRLQTPKIRSRLFNEWTGGKKLSLEAQNGREKESSKLIASSQGSILWTDCLSSPVLLMSGNQRFCAVACEDGSLHIYSHSGRRLLPTIVLEAQVSFLDSGLRYLLCVTQVGLVYVWDIQKRAALLSAVSAGPILQTSTLSDDSLHSSSLITSASVRPDGTPVLLTSTGRAFAYHLEMRVWVRAVDSWHRVSDFWTTGEDFGNDLTQQPGVLTQLQRSASAFTDSGSRSTLARELAKIDEGSQSAITMAHLENQLLSAELLKVPDEEYRHWLHNYARKLSDRGELTKVEELCREFLGPVQRMETGGIDEHPDWSPTILGLAKRDLLREILPILARNRHLQRIVMEYRASLERIDASRS